MYELDKEKARKIMIEEEGYTPYKVDLLLKDYPSIHEKLGDTVTQWLLDRTINDVVIEGLSIKQVMIKRQLHFLVAIKKLNTLLDKNIPIKVRNSLLRRLNRQVIFK